MAADAIIQFGRRFIGSHYLWGAAGATPNQQDGAYYRTGAVNLDADAKSNEKPSVFAASCDVDGHYVCAGNFKEFIDQTGGGYTYPSDVNLTKYLDEIRKLPSNSYWYPYKSRFTPRVMKGNNLGADDNRIVWGEDCRYVRHFDCVGFVNFVLSLTTSQKWSFSISQYAAGSITGATSVPLDSPIVDGDILVRNTEHIAFLCADGQVLQAQDHATSVHAKETFQAQRNKDNKAQTPPWTGRFRLPADIINAAGVTTWGAGGEDATKRWG
jgi:hypothetical protein